MDGSIERAPRSLRDALGSTPTGALACVYHRGFFFCHSGRPFRHPPVTRLSTSLPMVETMNLKMVMALVARAPLFAQTGAADGSIRGPSRMPPGARFRGPPLRPRTWRTDSSGQRPAPIPANSRCHYSCRDATKSGLRPTALRPTRKPVLWCNWLKPARWISG